jgi:hypothetical protein
MRISVFLPDNVDLTSIIHHIYAYTQYAILKFAQKIRPLQGFLEVQVSKTRDYQQLFSIYQGYLWRTIARKSTAVPKLPGTTHIPGEQIE